MALQSAYSFGTPRSTPVEIYQERLRWLLDRVEAELDNSEVYSNAIAGLQKIVGGSAKSAQMLIKAVGREAIRLTLQQLAQQFPVKNQVVEETEAIEPPVSLENPELELQNLSAVPLATAQYSPPRTAPQEKVNRKPEPKSGGNRPPEKAPKPPHSSNEQSLPKVTKTTLPDPQNLPNWEQRLRQIGKELQQARQARLISQAQMHLRTMVPLHHIDAIETGRIEELPEDIYIRGFIRRLADALGLNGAMMVDSLPTLESAQTVVPSWYREEMANGLCLTPVHLYLGYAALITGAVGGLVYVSQQAKTDNSNSHDLAVNFSSQKEATTTNIPGLNLSKNGISAGIDIAPPEAMGY
jgi:transcriptional regulator with XRE-family HTH domain